MKVVITQALAVFALIVAAAPVRAESVAVVLSSDAAPYQEALEGFREVVRHPIGGVQILQKNNPAVWQQQLKRLRSVIEPDLLFVIGSPALNLVSGEIKNIPVVHALAFNPVSVTTAGTKNVYGISMVPSASQVISLVRELNPEIRRVGTIYDPSKDSLLFSEARTAFQKSGLQLVGKEVHTEKDIGSALKSLVRNIEILWLWPDERFLAEEILQRIFLFSFETKIPVVGLSGRHTEMGAPVSISYRSARDMGRQAAEVANRLLSGGESLTTTVFAPRDLKLSVNLRIARKLGLVMPDNIIQRADNAIKAPIYENGDWWVFRIRTIIYSGKTQESVARVTYQNGKFVSEDPRLLSGGDESGTPEFLAFATFYFTELGKRWLKFPLLPGKTWSFRYHKRGNISNYRFGTSPVSWADADVEVTGEHLEPIKTPGGSIAAIRIDRTDNVEGTGYLRYYYSPQTKSVIKLTAERNDSLFSSFAPTKYELDLLDYGHGDSHSKSKPR